MSRLRTLFAFAALIAVTTALAACGGGESSGGDPQAVVDNATLKGIESGAIDLALSIVASGDEGGDVDVTLSGPFQSQGDDKLPQLDLTATANGSIGGEDIDFDGGLVLLANSGYVNYQGVDYEVDPTTFSFVESAIKQAQQQAGAEESADATGCQEAAAGLEVGDFVDNLSSEGGADVGGTDTTKVSGDLDVAGAIDAFVELAEDPACSSQLGAAGPLPAPEELDEAKGQVEEAVKAAHADVYVGEDDIVRRISAQLTIEPPAESGEGPEKVELSFDLTLTGVNEEQSIGAPESAKPLNDLFLKLGINPIELLGGENGAAGLGSLLEGLSGAAGGGSAGGEGSSGGGSQQAYLECLQGAKTPVDLQKCAALLG